MNNVITQAHLKASMSYAAYKKLMQKLLSEGKTTGPDQSAKMVEYTLLNSQRMSRLDKSIQLKPELIDALQQYSRPTYWLVLAEAWCGDVAQNLPVLAQMTDAAPNIELGILLRDEHLDVMDAYLTRGARSIPKLIALDSDTLEVLGQWGPRPAPVQQMVMEHKAAPEPKEPYSEFVKKVQLWYAKDKTLTLQNEILGLLKEWEHRS